MFALSNTFRQDILVQYIYTAILILQEWTALLSTSEDFACVVKGPTHDQQSTSKSNVTCNVTNFVTPGYKW